MLPVSNALAARCANDSAVLRLSSATAGAAATESKPNDRQNAMHRHASGDRRITAEFAGGCIMEGETTTDAKGWTTSAKRATPEGA